MTGVAAVPPDKDVAGIVGEDGGGIDGGCGALCCRARLCEVSVPRRVLGAVINCCEVERAGKRDGVRCDNARTLPMGMPMCKLAYPAYLN
jgi:hypothetical protein